MACVDFELELLKYHFTGVLISELLVHFYVYNEYLQHLHRYHIVNVILLHVFSDWFN